MSDLRVKREQILTHKNLETVHSIHFELWAFVVKVRDIDNPGQNVEEKVFSRIAAIFARSPLPPFPLPPPPPPPMQCWTTRRQAFPYEQHCMGGGGEGRIWPKERLFPCEKLIDGRGSAFCKLVPHNFGQDCSFILKGPCRTRTHCDGIADVIVFPIWLVLPDANMCFWKTSQTFLLSARRATMSLRVFFWDGQHCRAQSSLPQFLVSVGAQVWSWSDRIADLADGVYCREWPISKAVLRHGNRARVLIVVNKPQNSLRSPFGSRTYRDGE